MKADWTIVARSLDEARNRLESAANAEQFQAVGLLCRETLVSVAQVVYDSNIHKSSDGVVPSATDAKRMLEAYLSAELQGPTNEGTRRYAHAALSLANEVQHKRTASWRDAALCVEATTSVVRVVGLIAGYVHLPSKDAPFRKIKALMPELLAEMKQDLLEYPAVRDFVLAEKNWVLNFRDLVFRYYFGEHEDLQGKIFILENYGFVVDVTNKNIKRYRMKEEFVDFVTHL